MSISDRLMVLDDGVIQQIGSPVDIYGRSANEFSAVKNRSHKVLKLL